MLKYVRIYPHLKGSLFFLHPLHIFLYGPEKKIQCLLVFVVVYIIELLKNFHFYSHFSLQISSLMHFDLNCGFGFEISNFELIPFFILSGCPSRSPVILSLFLYISKIVKGFKDVFSLPTSNPILDGDQKT